MSNKKKRKKIILDPALVDELAKRLFAQAERGGTLKPPPAGVVGFSDGSRFAPTPRQTMWQDYRPEARQILATKKKKKKK